MNNLTSAAITLSQYPSFRRAQQLIARCPYASALGAIGVVAGAAAYYHSTRPTPLPSTPVVLNDFLNKATILVDFYNALPFDKPQLRRSSLLEDAAQAKHWMDGDGSQIIQNCQTLDLSSKRLQAIPPEIAQFTHLTTLELLNNQLTVLPPEIGQLQTLQILDLSNNALTVIPPEIGQLQTLQILDLTYNRLTALPPEIGQLQTLQILDLAYNRLTVLPPEIGQLQALQRIGLGDNQFIVPPPELGQLQTLEWINFQDNQLTVLPPEIEQLQTLQILDLSNNQLTVLPPEIGQLQTLQILDLSNNQLTVLPHSIFNLPLNCVIEVEHNLFTPDFISSFQQRLLDHRRNHPGQGPRVRFSISEQANVDPPPSLEALLRGWSEEFVETFPNNEANVEHWQNRTTDMAPLLSLSRNKIGYLNDFLGKITRVADYAPSTCTPETKKNMILRVERMVQLACTNPKFHKKMFQILKTGGTSCGDRAQILFNEIEIEWQFHHKPLSEAEFIQLAKKTALYELLEKHAKIFAEENDLNDEVEVILDFHLRLREEFDLPITTTKMLYRTVSGLDRYPAAIPAAKAIMLSHSQSSNDLLLSHSTHWKERLKLHNESAAAQVHKKFTDMVDEAEEFYNLQSDERNAWLEKCKKQNPQLHTILSDPTAGANYDIASRAIGNAREDALSRLADNESKD